jgi:hypothetical protein
LSTIKKRLQVVPPELSDVYKHIIKNVIRPENLQRTVLLFQWVVFAERPLSGKRLKWATACDNDGIANFGNEPFSEDVIDNNNLIKSLSGGLIEVQRGSNFVQFIHESVGEYVRESSLKLLLQECHRIFGKFGHYFGLDGNIIPESQARLARACIGCLRRSYLLLPESVFSMDNRNWVAADYFPRHHTIFVQVSANPLDRPHLLFLDYSERYWFRHSRKAELAGNDDQQLEKQFGLQSDAGKLAFHAWSNRIRLVETRLTSRRLYSNFLDIQSSQDLSGTILLLNNRIWFTGLQKYPHGLEYAELNKWKPLHHAAAWGHLNLV